MDTGQVFLKNAANATELPGVDFKGLNADQKKGRPASNECGNLHVRMQADGFAMPRQ